MAEVSGLMRGKRGLIMGVANNRSLAWGIAKACRAHGAELAFTYQGEALKKRVEPLAQEVGGIVVGHCDVTEPKTIDAVFAAVQSAWGAIDFLVHAMAFSDKDQLDGRYVDTTEDNFIKTMLVSCYSLTAIAQRAEKMMPNGGAMLTLTYYGAEKWMPHYNVMGVAKAALEASVWYLAADLGVKNIRVNAISSGPIKTLAAAGIRDLRYIFRWNEYNAPLRRNVTIEDVGEAGAYLLSDMSRGVTGEVHHVDAGYHIVGMKHPDAPDIAVGAAENRGRRQTTDKGRCIVRPPSSVVRRPVWNHAGPLFRPSRRNRFQRRGAPAGPARHRAQCPWPPAGRRLRRIAARSVRARCPRGCGFRLCGEPAAACARNHGDVARYARARSARRTLSTTG